MDRRATLLLVALVVGAATWTVATRMAPPPHVPPSSAATGSDFVSVVSPPTSTLLSVPTLEASAVPPPFDAAPPEDSAGSERSNPEAGRTLLDGRAAPPLPPTAPRSLRFGVILVPYVGAEQAPRGAPSRETAQARASDLATLGAQSFPRAVHSANAKRGELAAEDAGVLLRGVLEPAPEWVLFGLAAGEVGGPVDSPRGFYVFRRIE